MRLCARHRRWQKIIAAEHGLISRWPRPATVTERDWRSVGSTNRPITDGKCPRHTATLKRANRQIRSDHPAAPWHADCAGQRRERARVDPRNPMKAYAAVNTTGCARVRKAAMSHPPGYAQANRCPADGRADRVAAITPDAPTAVNDYDWLASLARDPPDCGSRVRLGLRCRRADQVVLVWCPGWPGEVEVFPAGLDAGWAGQRREWQLSTAGNHLRAGRGACGPSIPDRRRYPRARVAACR